MLVRLATCALCLLAATTARADDTPAAATLPGVSAGHSIVAPMPEPPAPPAPPSGSNTTQVGAWELTVSGYVWVQVGASSRRPD